jgi:hypothetical protein
MTTAAELYALARRNQATMRAVENEMKREALQVLTVAEGLTQQQMGGFLRSTVPGLVDKYGQVNATAAMNYYNERRLLSLPRNLGAISSRQARQNITRRASNRATAELRSQVFLAQRPAVNPVQLAQSPINYAMKVYQGSGYDPMRNELTNALTRAVASYNRDTILYNSALDEAVVGVQRVAEAGACGFCQTLALGTIEPARSVPSYAVEYHNNCRCSIETLYEGDRPIRPEYYEDFEANYEEAKATREEGQTVIERFNQLVRTPEDD